MKITARGWIVVGTFTAAAVAIAILTAPLLHAQNTAPAAVTSQIPASGASEESLGTMLQSMGLTVTKSEQRYDFAFKAVIDEEDWNLSMSAVLSQDGQSVWVMAWLDELPKSAADVPRTALLRLLSDNDKLGNGKFFAYIAANRRFVLQRVVPNTNMNATTLRATLQDLGESVVLTYPHWSVENWKAGTTPTQPASATTTTTTQP